MQKYFTLPLLKLKSQRATSLIFQQKPQKITFTSKIDSIITIKYLPSYILYKLYLALSHLKNNALNKHLPI